MKKYIAIILLFSSCSVLKQKPIPAPTQEKVPNVISRTVPTLPDMNLPDAIAIKKLRDSVLRMALTMDTIIYNTHSTVKYQNKVIDTLWERQGKYEKVIDSLVKVNKKTRDELDKFKYTYFRPEYFGVDNGVMDSISIIKPLPQPQSLGRTQSPSPSPSWFYYHSIQYPVND